MYKGSIDKNTPCVRKGIAMSSGQTPHTRKTRSTEADVVIVVMGAEHIEMQTNAQ